MAMLNNRNINQALVCIIPLVCILLNGLTVTEEDLTRKVFFSDKMTVCVAAFTCGIVLLTNIGVVTMSQTNKAIGYLQDHYSEDKKIFNTINQGSMLEYYGYKPYIDTRLEVFGKENNGTFDYLGEYFDICEGKTRLEDVVKKYDFDVLFLVNIEGTPIERGLKEIPFKTVYDKDGALILEKENQG